MATANIDLRNGTTIVIEGTPEEIARVLLLYHGSDRASPTAHDGDSPSAVRQKKRSKEKREPAPRARAGAMQHIRDLIGESFFRERRSLAEVQGKLEELGHIYPMTHLSTPLRRLVVGKELRRLRNGKNWAYVDG